MDSFEKGRVGRPPLGDQARKQISVRLAPDVMDALKTHASASFGQELDRVLREAYGLTEPGPDAPGV